MRKNTNSICLAVASTLGLCKLHDRYCRFAAMILLATLIGAAQSFAQAGSGTMTLPADAFAVTLKLDTVDGHQQGKVRVTMLPNSIQGIQGIQGLSLNLRLKVPNISTRLETIGWATAMDSVSGEANRNASLPNTYEVDAHSWSANPWKGQGSLWVEWTFAPLGNGDLTNAIACLDGIIVVIIIEGLKVAPQVVTPTSDEAVRIYPNPATDRICLQLGSEAEEPRYFKLVNLNGSIVAATTSKEAEVCFDLQQLPKGVYFVAWTQDGNSFQSLKFLKQ